QIHSKTAKAQLPEYFIGRLKPEGSESPGPLSPAAQRQIAFESQGKVLVQMAGPDEENPGFAQLNLDPKKATLKRLRQLLRMVFHSRLRCPKMPTIEAVRVLIDGKDCREEEKTLFELGV
ncbi:NIA1, partial [Symbiodinium pilosum]